MRIEAGIAANNSLFACAMKALQISPVLQREERY